MLEDYLLVHKSILPPFFESVLEARKLLDEGKVKNVSQAAKQCGISRSTYYKYRDCILQASNIKTGRKAVLGMLLTHEAGVLSSVLQTISGTNASVLTITQSLPIHAKASVTISLDIGTLNGSIHTLIDKIAILKGVENPRLIAIE